MWGVDEVGRGSDYVLVFEETESDDLFSVSARLAEAGVVRRTERGNGRLVLRRRSDRQDQRYEEDGGCE